MFSPGENEAVPFSVHVSPPTLQPLRPVATATPAKASEKNEERSRSLRPTDLTIRTPCTAGTPSRAT